MNFDCPLPSTLGTIPDNLCPETWGQIVRVGVQLRQATSTFTAATIGLKATWTPLIAETDETKIVISPPILDFKIPTNEIIKEGGNDNTTIGGVPEVKGLGFCDVTGLLKNINAATHAAMKALMPYSMSPMAGVSQLQVYLFTADNRVLYVEGATSGQSKYADGIVAYNLTVSDRGSEGHNQHTISNFSMQFKGGWSDNVKIVDLDFDPLTLVAPVVTP